MLLPNCPQAVQLKKCPNCSVPIRVCNRYNAVIKQKLLDIEKVKKMTWDNYQAMVKGAMDLQTELREQLRIAAGVGPTTDIDVKYLTKKYEKETFRWRKFFDVLALFDRVATRVRVLMVTAEWFDVVRAQADHLMNLHAFREHLLAKITAPLVPPKPSDASQGNSSEGRQDQISTEARTALNKLDGLLDVFMESTVSRAAVLRCAYNASLLRMTTDLCFASLLPQRTAVSASVTQRLQSAQTRLSQAASNELSADDLKELETEVHTICNLLGVPPTPQELPEIHQALQLLSGRWFKCLNGHLFVIDNCGGAEETAKCSECEEIIGGTDHKLIGGTHTGEIDGSSGPAYQGRRTLFGVR